MATESAAVEGSSRRRTRKHTPDRSARDVCQPERNDPAPAFPIGDEPFRSAQEVIGDFYIGGVHACASDMECAGIVGDDDPPAVSGRSLTEVGLLAVEPIAGVEAAQRFEERAPHEEARPSDESFGRMCRSAVQSESLEPRPARRREMPVHSLFRAVFVRDSRARDPDERICIEDGQEFVEIDRAYRGVGIEKEDHVTGAEGGTLVGRGCEAGVHVIDYDLVAERSNDVSGSISRLVVYNDYLHVVGQRIQRAADVVC
jgi:hypothetical protein